MPTVEFVRPTGEAKGSINQGGDLKNELRLVTGAHPGNDIAQEGRRGRGSGAAFADGGAGCAQASGLRFPHVPRIAVPPGRVQFANARTKRGP